MADDKEEKAPRFAGIGGHRCLAAAIRYLKRSRTNAQ